jgi:plastocyanin
MKAALVSIGQHEQFSEQLNDGRDRVMSVYLLMAAVAATVLSTSACGSYSNPSPSAPTGSAAPPAGAIVINVIGINGAQSFSPNPATVPAGQTVVWHNVDTVTHRVVFNDGEVDTGNIAPGAFSAAMGLVAPGPYHCSIHPPMVGTTVGQ